MEPTAVLATVTGRDRAGVTAAFFAALAAHDVEVRDVEQVVIRDRLILAVLLDLRGEVAPLRESVSRTAHALGMDAEVVLAGAVGPARSDGSSDHHVIVIGHPLRPGAVGALASRVTDLGGTIDTIRQLSHDPASSLELLVSVPDEAGLRAALVAASAEVGLDIAVEPAALVRRAKRLVIIDVDSTLIRDDDIDILAELAELAGAGPRVGERARPSKDGQVDVEQTLRARVESLRGLPEAAVIAAHERIALTPGAETFVRTLKHLGYHVGIVSRGFSVLTNRFVAELDLDFAAANQLEVADGVLTGRLVGPILDRAAKAAALRLFAARFEVPLAQTVAVGDSNDDIDMIDAAGLGIAFNGKLAREAAALAAPIGHLESVLFVLGISGREIARSRLSRTPSV